MESQTQPFECPNLRTRLLVSVRGADEVSAALAGGAEIIDVKDPAAGSLGAASPATLREVVHRVAGQVPVSAALGELCHWRASSAELPAGIGWAKLGLSEMSAHADWPGKWREAYEMLPPAVERVAVLYADHQVAQTPATEEVLAQCLKLHCTTVLIDTFDKTNGNLLKHLSLDALASLIRAVRQYPLSIALAGSLTQEAICEVLPLRPDYLAVRSAACRGGRLGKVCGDRVREISQLIATFADTLSR